MKKLIALITLISMVYTQPVLAVGKLQNQDFKTSAELAAGGATDASFLNDTKIYVTANSLNKTLAAAITAGDLAGGVAKTSSTGSAVLPSGTTAQRDASPVNGYTRYNTSINSVEFYNNGAWFPLDNTKPINSTTFTATGASTFTVPAGITKLTVVVVGGGGGGGTGNGALTAGAGGGGGSMTFTTEYSVVPGQVIKTFVGQGGIGGNSSGLQGTAGTASYFGSLVAQGGGAGASAGIAGGTRGNGGGGNANGNGPSNPTAYSQNQGSQFLASSVGLFNGGTGAGTGASTELGGGGGGNGGNGGNATAGTSAGNGANGFAVSFSGSSVTYGGGGGGASYGGAKPAGTGGTGGGGAGGLNAAGTSGTANTGGGGGGAAGDGDINAAGSGGSGFIGVYY